VETLPGAGPLRSARTGYRCRRRGLATATGALALALALPAASSRLSASPLDDPHIGGIGFSGPAAPEISSIYWNPAAVGLVTGNQAMVGGTGRFSALGLARAPIDPTTGLPGGDRTFAPASGKSRLHPASWPLGPGGFLGLAASVGTRFTFALATYSPFNQQVRWSPAADGSEPARYHAVSTDLRNLALVPAVSIRLGGGVRFGAAPGFLLSLGRLVVDEDTALQRPGPTACQSAPCGVENPAAAARYDVSSGFRLLDGSLSLTVAGGLHVDRPKWMFGVAFISRPLGTREGVEIKGRATSIRPPPSGNGPLCPAEATASCLWSQAVYQLPDTLTAGLDLRIKRRWLVGGMLRWLNLSRHDAIRIRVVGPAISSLRNLSLPEELVLHRGLRDVFDIRGRAVFQLREGIELAAVLRAESSAVRPESLSAGFVDGAKLEPALAARVRVASGFSLTAGYAFTFVPTVEASRSVFDPGAELACQQAGGDLASEPCRKRQAGQARPTAAGRYNLHTHSFSLTVTAQL
jgi:long-subunit fatty acid transport protein